MFQPSLKRLRQVALSRHGLAKEDIHCAGSTSGVSTRGKESDALRAISAFGRDMTRSTSDWKAITSACIVARASRLTTTWGSGPSLAVHIAALLLEAFRRDSIACFNCRCSAFTNRSSALRRWRSKPFCSNNWRSGASPCELWAEMQRNFHFVRPLELDGEGLR